MIHIVILYYNESLLVVFFLIMFSLTTHAFCLCFKLQRGPFSVVNRVTKNVTPEGGPHC